MEYFVSKAIQVLFDNSCHAGEKGVGYIFHQHTDDLAFAGPEALRHVVRMVPDFPDIILYPFFQNAADAFLLSLTV